MRVGAGHVVGALHHLEADILLQTLNINKHSVSRRLNKPVTHISAERAAALLEPDHQTPGTLVEADLAEHLPLRGGGLAPLVQHQRHLGAGPGVDSAGGGGHRDDGGAAGAVDHRGPGPGNDELLWNGPGPNILEWTTDKWDLAMMGFVQAIRHDETMRIEAT